MPLNTPLGQSVPKPALDTGTFILAWQCMYPFTYPSLSFCRYRCIELSQRVCFAILAQAKDKSAPKESLTALADLAEQVHARVWFRCYMCRVYG